MSITIYSPKYVNVILPLAVPKNYTYKVPSSMCGDIEFGKRVEVPLRNRAYSAIIVETMNEANVTYKAKDIRAVIDKEPIITEKQYDLWKWMAKYYCCTVGEVMMVALPSGLKLTSETKLIISPDFDEDYSDFDEMEYLIAEAISIQNELTIDQVKDITDRKVVYPYIRKLLDRRVLYIKEELRSKYKPKQITVVALSDSYEDTEASMNVAFERIGKSELQHKALLSFYKLYRQQNEVPKAALMELSGVSSAVIKGLEKKGILDIYKKEISRLTIADVIDEAVMPPLSTQQIDAIATIKEAWEEKETCLIHGITGSGKTRVYMELMQEYLDKGKQVLYLLPEIALTSQIVNRLEAVFGDRIVLYHSRLNQHERVEIWNAVLHEAKILVGARSSLLLPYRNIGLIIVDEEHDGSYKQHDPSPRYNARDTASVIASQFGAKVLLGSATPSLESYFNAKLGKYGLTELRQRHSKVALPEIEIVDLKIAYKTGRMKSHFSLQLRKSIDKALEEEEQVIIFQNRRGYTPTLNCDVCGWSAQCANCDVGLTYHKFFHELRCHYCGYRSKKVKCCPDCGNDQLTDAGLGTEKIEDILMDLYPKARVKRMDFDTVRSKNSHEKILMEFGNREIDILVGTQMITKGLDFDHIAVVGILNADKLLQFPDIRAGERAFQLMTQVAGRAGRRKKQGKVLIQTFQPDHPVIRETVMGAYNLMFRREMGERKAFHYPPYNRMITVLLKHKKPDTVDEAALVYANLVGSKLGTRVIGPSPPGIARVRGLYLQHLIVKLEKDTKVLHAAKVWLQEAKAAVQNMPGFKSVRINIDVDPY